jgi:hypothetical protein
MRLNLWRIRLLTALVILGGPISSLADSFRCGGYLAREGRPASEIETECGQPDLVKRSEEPIIVRRPNGSIFANGVTITDYWYYERGPNQFVARVTIREGIAEEIELLSARLLESLDLD